MVGRAEKELTESEAAEGDQRSVYSLGASSHARVYVGSSELNATEIVLRRTKFREV